MSSSSKAAGANIDEALQPYRPMLHGTSAGSGVRPPRARDPSQETPSTLPLRTWDRPLLEVRGKSVQKTTSKHGSRTTWRCPARRSALARRRDLPRSHAAAQRGLEPEARERRERLVGRASTAFRPSPRPRRGNLQRYTVRPAGRTSETPNDCSSGRTRHGAQMSLETDLTTPELGMNAAPHLRVNNVPDRPFST